MPNSFMFELVSSLLKHAFCMFYMFFSGIHSPARFNKNECVGETCWVINVGVSLASRVTWKHFHNMSSIISVWSQIMKLHAHVEPASACLEKTRAYWAHWESYQGKWFLILLSAFANPQPQIFDAASRRCCFSYWERWGADYAGFGLFSLEGATRTQTAEKLMWWLGT